MNYERVKQLAKKKMLEKQQALRSLKGAEKEKAELLILKEAEKESKEEQEDFGTADLSEPDLEPESQQKGVKRGTKPRK